MNEKQIENNIIEQVIKALALLKQKDDQIVWDIKTELIKLREQFLSFQQENNHSHGDIKFCMDGLLMEKKIQNGRVLKSEEKITNIEKQMIGYNPVKAIVYSMVAMILAAFIGGILSVLLKI